MSSDIVITEKSSQARDVRAALGNRYGPILPAEGHLIVLREPEEVNPDWKRRTPVLLRPEGLFGTKPATGGNKASKLKAIKEALRSARRVWLATDCDREGQLIGQEILEHFRFRGEVMRVMFTAQFRLQEARSSFATGRPPPAPPGGSAKPAPPILVPDLGSLGVRCLVAATQQSRACAVRPQALLLHPVVIQIKGLLRSARYVSFGRENNHDRINRGAG